MITVAWIIVVMFAFIIGIFMGNSSLKAMIENSGYWVKRQKDGTYLVIDIKEKIEQEQTK